MSEGESLQSEQSAPPDSLSGSVQPRPLVVPAAPIQVQPPEVGEVAPDFELPDSRRQLHRLQELVAARPQVVLFYRGHW